MSENQKIQHPKPPDSQTTSSSAPTPEKSKTGRSIRLVVGCIVGGLIIIGILVGLSPLKTRKTNEGAMRASCKNNLRQVGIAMHLYADEYDGAFPLILAQLYTGNYTDGSVKIFSCPDNPSSYEDFRTGKITERSSSYAYFPGRWYCLPGDFILAYDKTPKNHGGDGFNVLYVDSSVRWVGRSDIPVFMKTLADQEARLPELRQKWEEQKKAGKKSSPIGSEVPPAPVPAGG
jgi:prepilin-type processing-associated H-X9-DG protein